MIGLVVVAGAVLVGTGTISLNALDGETDTGVNVNDWGVDAQVSFSATPSSADVMLFEERPEDFGNYADFSASDAKSGLELGVDYREQTGVSTDTATFDDLDTGTYYLVVEDSNYNTQFKEVKMPETVSTSFAENDKAVTLVSGSEMSTVASYGSDNVVSYDDDGNVLATGTDLPAPASDGVQTVTIERNIDVDTGVSLLGNLETTSFNDGDGIEDVEVSVNADGSQVYSKSLKDGSSGELADGTTFGEDLEESVDTEPIRSSDSIEVVYEVTAQMSTAASSAGDGALQDGENILTTGLDDVTGGDVSTATKAYTR